VDQPEGGRRFEAMVRAGGWPEYSMDPDGWYALASSLVGAEFRDAEDVHTRRSRSEVSLTSP
jgi:hypothetical protein